MEEKKDILTIKISDLTAHFSSSSKTNQVISEAVSCSKCDHKFADNKSFTSLLLSTLTPEMQSLMPVPVDKRWSELLLKCPWEPLDASATAQNLTRQKDEESPYVVSNDPVRKELLGKIQGAIELLLRHKYLCEYTLRHIIKSAMKDLEGLPIGSHILSEALDQTPLCICFIGPTTLTEILKLLDEISQICCIGIYSEVGVDKKKSKQSSKAKLVSSSPQ